MKENIETKDVQRTEYLDKNGIDMLWAKVKENTHNLVEVERDRATTQENRIIETKADKSELHSSYVSNSTFTALLEKVEANTDAISDKLDAGNYLSYNTLNNEGYYEIPDVRIPGNGGNTKTDIDSLSISVNCDYPASHTTITCDGISNTDNNANHVFATDGSIADLTGYIKIAGNIATGVNHLVRTVDVINNNIGVGDNDSRLAYIGKGELGAIGYNGDGSATESFRYSIRYGLETTNTSGYKNVAIPCDSNVIKVYKYNSNDHNTRYGYSGILLGENNDDSNLLNTNGSYKTIGTDITPLENGKVPAEYLDLSQYAKKSEISAGGNVDDVQVNGVSVVENKIANIKPATKESLGVVKVGDGLNVADGTISVDSTAIGAGNYIPYNKTYESYYTIDGGLVISGEDCNSFYDKGSINFTYNNDSLLFNLSSNLIYGRVGNNSYTINAEDGIELRNGTYRIAISGTNGLRVYTTNDDGRIAKTTLISEGAIEFTDAQNGDYIFRINEAGIHYNGRKENEIPTANGGFVNINNYALKTELPTVPTKVSLLLNDSEFIAKSVYDEKIAALEARIAALEAKHAETA